MFIDIIVIDNSRPLFEPLVIDELDIFELLEAIDKEFGTNLWDNQDIDQYRVSIDDLITLIEQEVNK